MNRVCFISLSAYGYFNEDAPAGGGAQRQFYLLSTNLTDTFDVHFVVGDYGQPKTERREGVTLHRAYTPNSSASTPQRMKQLARLWRALRRANADVYIVRCRPQKLNIIFSLVTMFRRPLIYHIATDEFVSNLPMGISGLQQKLYYRVLQRCSVASQTHYQAEQLQRYWDTDSTIIPNGYPPASVVDMHKSREYFLWVGRLDEKEKRPHLFLNLADKLPEQQFLLIGPPRQQDSYSQQLIQRASDTSNVTYTGRVPPSDVHDYYQRAIALVNTSARKKEGFPNTFIEAWRYGTSVLALAVDPERFLGSEHGVTGYAEGEFETLVSMTQELADSTKKRRELGVIGMETFEQRYHLETVVNSYRKVLEETISDE